MSPAVTTRRPHDLGHDVGSESGREGEGEDEDEERSQCCRPLLLLQSLLLLLCPQLFSSKTNRDVHMGKNHDDQAGGGWVMDGSSSAKQPTWTERRMHDGRIRFAVKRESRTRPSLSQPLP